MSTPLSAGGLNLLPSFQKEALDRISILRGVAEKEGVAFFREGEVAVLTIKNKLKSEIFNGKSDYKQNPLCHD